MDLLTVERVGGLAGFGGVGSRIRSRGQIVISKLPQADQDTLDKLFQSYSRSKKKPSALRDGFSYRISRTSGSEPETIEVPESLVPASIAGCVRDELL